MIPYRAKEIEYIPEVKGDESELDALYLLKPTSGMIARLFVFRITIVPN
jgi:hypothetical protein